MIDTSGSLLVMRKPANMSTVVFEHFNHLLQAARNEALLCYGEMNTGLLADNDSSIQQQLVIMEAATTSTEHLEQREQQSNMLAQSLYLKFQHILQDSKTVNAEHIPEFFTMKKAEVLQVVHEVLQCQPLQHNPANTSLENTSKGTNAVDVQVKDNAPSKMSEADLFNGSVLYNRKRLSDGSPKASNNSEYESALLINGPKSKVHTRFYRFPAAEVTAQLNSLNNDGFIKLVRSIDASLLNQRILFRVLDRSNAVIDDFELDVGIIPSANRHLTPNHFNTAKSYASVDQVYSRSEVFRDEKRSLGRRKRQKKRHESFYYDYSRYDEVSVEREELEDKYDTQPVNQRASPIETVQPLKTFEEPAKHCDFYAYALQSVHNEDRKYHLKNIPSTCTNDASVMEHFQADDIQHLTPEFFTTINRTTFSKLPGKKSINPDQMASLPAECLQSLTIEEVREMRDDVLEKVSPDKLVVLPADVRACKIKTESQPVSQEVPLKDQSSTKFALPVSLGILGAIAGYAGLALFI